MTAPPESFPKGLYNQGRLFFAIDMNERRTLFFRGTGHAFRLLGLGTGFPVCAPPYFAPFRTLIAFTHGAFSLLCD